MIKLGITGFCGKMGQRIYALSLHDKIFSLAAAIERSGHPDIGKKIGSVTISDNREEIKKCDCLVDFTAPAATMANLVYLVQYKKCAVIGTTGIDPAGQKKIKDAAKKIPIIFSPNMSIGVNVFFKLIGKASEKLNGYSVSIEEAHHIHKKDAPSGTAKQMAKIVQEKELSVKTEDIRSIRKGEIVGDHRIVFESAVDTIEIFHSAKTRDIFASGALTAAVWISKKKTNGLYSMHDVLGLND
ncbi:MAG: 4-hydroxy-tetrahydrodipicolinate reductase [Candidatus Omnitrophota bacterium]|nr:4-hydroxy-tetrahydrodipicolinate reductase [Candidatus Omnitrophota bacterium]